MIARNVAHVFYGGDYNLEQRPEEVWAEDVRKMREAGVKLVSLGIFFPLKPPSCGRHRKDDRESRK